MLLTHFDDLQVFAKNATLQLRKQCDHGLWKERNGNSISKEGYHGGLKEFQSIITTYTTICDPVSIKSNFFLNIKSQMSQMSCKCCRVFKQVNKERGGLTLAISSVPTRVSIAREMEEG